MTRLLQAILAFLITTLLLGSGFAPVVSAQGADPSSRIDELLERYQALGLFNGSVLVADHGAVVMRKGYGLANMEWGVPNAADTKFRLGSITKQFTATLIMQLVEQGMIDLAAPLTRYLPEYPARTGDRVTVHQLLNHTSGIVGFTEIPSFGATVRNPYTPTKFLDVFSKFDLLFEPGTMYSYNNSAYFLLGVILEEVTGRTYEELLRERIFEPLGMGNSGYDSPQLLLSNRAAGYGKRFDGSYVNTPYLDMTQPYSAGALYSTVDDLYRWDQSLYTEQILSAESKAQMFTPGLSDYGYGWVITEEDGVATIEHGGTINGFNTLITRNVESQRLIVLLNNTGGAPLDEMADSIRAILDGNEPTMPKQPAAVMLFETYQASGLSAALVQANNMQDSALYNVGNGELSRLVRQLLAVGEVADGLELAKLLVEDSPESAGAAELLARAHLANGHRIEAAQNLSRAIILSETPRSFLLYTDALREISALKPTAVK